MDSEGRVETMARRIQGEIASQIETACENASPLEWKSRAERIVDETPGIEDWEYQLLERLGRPPEIVLTAYNPSRHKGE